MYRQSRHWAMILSLVCNCSFYAGAESAPFVEDFEDSLHEFKLSSTQTHTPGGGVSDSAWSIKDASGNRVLRNQILLRTLGNDDSSLVYTSRYIVAPNVPNRGNFQFSVDVDVSHLLSKANDPSVPDYSITVALGFLGGNDGSPFTGFDDENDGQSYYLATYTLSAGGDETDPWSGSEGTLRLFEHGGDDRVDSRATGAVKPKFTFTIRGKYQNDGLFIQAIIDDGSDFLIGGIDSTPLQGTYFGFRTAAFARAGTNPGDDLSVTVDYDNVRMIKTFQPDVAIARRNRDQFKGLGIINRKGNHQKVPITVNAGGTARFSVRIRNSGTKTDSFLVFGQGSAPGFTVTYLDGNTDVTDEVVGFGSYVVRNVPPGDFRDLRMLVKTDATGADSRNYKIFVWSGSKPLSRDAVKPKVFIR